MAFKSKWVCKVLYEENEITMDPSEENILKYFLRWISAFKPYEEFVEISQTNFKYILSFEEIQIKELVQSKRVIFEHDKSKGVKIIGILWREVNFYKELIS